MVKDGSNNQLAITIFDPVIDSAESIVSWIEKRRRTRTKIRTRTRVRSKSWRKGEEEKMRRRKSMEGKFDTVMRRRRWRKRRRTMSVSHCPQSLAHAQSRAAKSYLSTPYLTATSLLLLLRFYSNTFFPFLSVLSLIIIDWPSL